jgi:hypothetical protein
MILKLQGLITSHTVRDYGIGFNTIVVAAFCILSSLPLSHCQGEVSAQSTGKGAPPHEGAKVNDYRTIRQQSVRKPKIPAAAGVGKMIAEAYAHPLPAQDIGPFEVPNRHFEQILQHFHNAEIDSEPSLAGQELGTARLIFPHGATVRICWFWVGHKGRMYFSYGGIRYRTVGTKFADDETLAFDALIRKIHEEINMRQAAHGRGPVLQSP